jgi:cyclohexa-1,5-dienecarbonyl-CoA hydratase
MAEASNPLVRTEWLERGSLLRLVLDRPKANILTGAMMKALSAELQASRSDPHLKLVVIEGAGGNFSYGASVEEHRREAAPAMLQAFHALLRQVAASPMPVAALVEGRCLGGAFELALACHLVLATGDAIFGCPEIKLGVFPPALAVLGPLRLGGARAERLLLTGDDLTVAEAREAGLLAAVLPHGDAWAAFLAWFRAGLAKLSAAALRHAVYASRVQVQAALGEPLDSLERLYLGAVIPSHDGNEGIDAFLERRAPRWEDR